MAKSKAAVSDGVVETDDLITQARKAYDQATEWWSDNQKEAKDDLRFARLGEQWDSAIKRQRELEHRPCLTFNKMPAFIRQVVNDARQNKPAIKVHPQDSNADPRTAEIINGLIRNIETTSDADVAYDTAIEHAVGQGFGYWRINSAYTSDDVFDQDIVIERISNPFTVYGDPRSTAADSSDWNEAFVVTTMTKDEFEAEYPDAEKTDWDADFKDCRGWLDGDDVTVAEWWTRDKVKGAIVALNDGTVLSVDEYKEHADELTQIGIEPVGEPRETETYKVTQRVMSGAEILKTVEWAGKYIPIVPVYGDEVIDEDGKRHFRSLIRDAKSAQQMFNYWRTTTTELVALAPKAPFVGEERAFGLDPNWNTANSQSHPYLMVPTGAQLPQRQPFSGVPAGALQEALNANDDMKAIIGLYDPSLGARSNETSGVAINARQREGDTSTFHFIDNLSRAIRHGGRILLDLIPKVYSTERMIRVLGEDMQPQNVQIQPGAPPQTQQEMPQGQEENDAAADFVRVYDITAGKYDLTVSAGPSYTSRRDEAQEIMTEWAQAGGAEVAAILAPRIAKLLDLPDADEIAKELEFLNPAKQAEMAQQGQQVPPQVQQQMQQMGQMIQQGGQELQRLQQENAQLQAQLKDKGLDAQQNAQKLEIDAYRAQTERMKANAELMKPTEIPRQPPTQPGAVN